MLRQEDLTRLKYNMLDCMAQATACGHHLSTWEPVEGTDNLGYQAVCQRCGLKVYTSAAKSFSLLAEVCPQA